MLSSVAAVDIGVERQSGQKQYGCQQGDTHRYDKFLVELVTIDIKAI